MTIITASESETIAAGRELAGSLEPGQIVLLFGDLGAGKTAFVRGLAEGLGIDPGDVSSPTFTIIQEYRGARGTLLHVDLYRLDAREVDDLGLDELGEQAIVAIEWAERLPRQPNGVVQVQLSHHGGDKREITISRTEQSSGD